MPRNTDEQIKNAMENGEFDNLPGQGKPLSLQDYFETPAEMRMAQSVLKNAGIVPEEVRLLNEIAELKDQLRTRPDKDLQKKLQAVQLKYDILMDAHRRRARS